MQDLPDVTEDRAGARRRSLRCRRPARIGKCFDQHPDDGGNLGNVDGSGGDAHAVSPVAEDDDAP
jgi:hypothetical protein